ncbi:MAG: septum formation initiator family protein [Peptococcaceae bacterium]|nr:septum formation initiator family protein [Peptococcaceae bacterium]
MKNKISPKRQGRKKGRKMSPLYVVVTFVFLVLVITWSVQLNKTERDLNARIQELTRQKTDLIAQNDSFRKEIELLNTPDYIEQLARDKLGLVRKGEYVVAPKKDR